MMANYNVGFAVPNCLILERPALFNPLHSALLVEPFEMIDGFALPPRGPGLGVVFKDEVLQTICIGRE